MSVAVAPGDVAANQEGLSFVALVVRAVQVNWASMRLGDGAPRAVARRWPSGTGAAPSARRLRCRARPSGLRGGAGG